jgi:4-amino-4-deoxy-L-arabinose transferase-like glycosyltransferase
MTSAGARPKQLEVSKQFRAGAIGAAIAALLTLPGLGSGTLWDNSETAYGEVAREILLTHDWLVMHMNGLSWFVQPPLYFWIAAACVKAFGVTSFALRLPSALATIAMGGAVAYAGTRQLGARAGVYAAVVLSTSLMQAVVGRLAIMDALLDLAVAMTIFWWFRALQTGEDRYVVLGAVASALGFLAKGPVAPVVALLVLLPYAWWDRAVLHRPRARAYVWALLAFVAICTPWFAAFVARSGPQAAARLIGHYTIGRYTGTIENQSGPLWYYVPVLILGIFPWIAFLPSSIAYALTRLGAANATSSQTDRSIIRLSLCWLIIPFLFFSFARTKLPNYIALELPAPALLIGMYLDDVVARVRSRSALISTAVIPACIVLVAVAIVWFTHDNRLTGELRRMELDLIYVGAAIALGAVVAYALLLGDERRRSNAPYAVGVSMGIAFLFIALLALPQTDAFKPVPHFARVIDSQLRGGDAIAISSLAGGNALTFYTRPPVYSLVGPNDVRTDEPHYDPRAVICSHGRTWLVTSMSAAPPQYGKAPQLIARYGKADLYLYSDRPCMPVSS